MFKMLSGLIAVLVAIALFGFLTGYFISADEAAEDTKSEIINKNIHQ